ncbi:hypothetical protein MYX77_00905 [Acidobacteriia bacterium AH_259_A11_L15]|nr:hypothetical protein [Acidobacteriia bacterium AH_259_A11_L15]
MIISVINHTSGKISDEEVQHTIRAINRQIAEDFDPYWSLSATLRLEGKSTLSPDRQEPADMRGDAIIYLWDKTDVPNALGYHDANNRGIPFGFVFTDLAEAIGEKWTVTLSHEALELLADPEVNLLVMGAHPADPNKIVFHWYEMCDAVQAETYEIDGVALSNFLFPLYFTSSEELGGRNDFLGRIHNGQTLKSFGVNPGGYVGFFNPETGRHETFSMKGDLVAAKRLELKAKAKGARRAIRYQRPVAREQVQGD